MIDLLDDLLTEGYSIHLWPEPNGKFVAIRKTFPADTQYIVRAAATYEEAFDLAWAAILAGKGFSAKVVPTFTLEPPHQDIMSFFKPTQTFTRRKL